MTVNKSDNNRIEAIRELIAKLENTDRGGWQYNVAVHKSQAANALNSFESTVFIDCNEEGFYFGPSYTQRMDDAMSLIPGGWKNISITEDNGTYTAIITNETNTKFSNIGTGATVPLAICIAGLKIIEANS